MSRTNQKVLTATVALMLLAAVVSASDLRPGEAVHGTLAPDAAQAFTMDCAAGDAVQITLKAKGAGDAAPSITIRGPSGDTVAAARGSRKIKARFTAPRTGSYEVRIAALAGSSARYQMKVKGERKRAHAARGDEIRFGAPSGAEVRFKVKTAGTPRAEMRDSRDRQVALLQNGARFRSMVLSATDEYRITAPGASRIKVKVLYPDSRGALVVESPGSSYDAPPAGIPAGGGSGDANDPQDPADETDGTESTPEGEVTDPANDGSVSGNGGNGTVPAPAVAADHAYLIELLSAEEDVDIQKARVESTEDRPSDEVAARLRQLPDPIAQDLAERLMARDDEMVSPAAQAYLLDLVAAQRRVDRARSRLVALEAQVPGSAMAGDVAYDMGVSALVAAMAQTEAAVAQAIANDLERRLSDEPAGPDAVSLDAAAAPAASQEIHVGIAAMDAALANGLMTRAREGNREAREALRILTAAYERALSAFPGIDANPAATQAALNQRQAELAALEQEHGEFALAAEPMAAPQADQDYEIVVRALGANGLAIDWSVEGAEVEAQVEAAGLRLAVRGHADERSIVVRAELAGREQILEMRIQPQEQDEANNDEPTPALRGTALFGDEPAPGLSVQILWNEQIVVESQTDGEGRFAIDELPAGDYIVRIGDFEMGFAMDPVDPLDLGPIHLN